VINDIDIHKLNLWPFGSLNFLVENSLKNVILKKINNEGKIIYVVKKKNTK
jgi:hypothetical protein